MAPSAGPVPGAVPATSSHRTMASAEAGADTPPTMMLNDEDAAFRDEVRAFLDRALTPDLRAAGRRCSGIFSDYPDGIRWHRRLAERGWSVPHWPVAHGGTGWTPMQHYLFASELAAADAPPLAPMGTHMVGPVIVAFGTPEQQQRWLPGIRSGDDYWAQGYSEPQAGSDLASLQCKAVREGDGADAVYVVNGSKIWNTHAHHANRMFLLVRTAHTGKPQAGISFLCLDLGLPGVTVRPIRSISGDHELNQVFFDDVRVPVSGLIGEENQGWRIAKYLLEHERGGAWSPGLRARLRRLRSALDAAFPTRDAGASHGAADAGGAGIDAVAGTAGMVDDGHREEHRELLLRLADLACQVDAVQALELRALAAQQRGEPAGVRPSIGKLLGSETRQRITELGLDIAAHHAHLRLPMEDAADPLLPVPESSLFAMSAYLNDRAASIYAGTSEVQRNIVAGALLAGTSAASAAASAFPLDETQALLRDSLSRFLADHFDVESRARLLDRAEREPPLWSAFARQLGLLGAGFAESQGGYGGGLRDQLIVLETLGGHLAAEPYLSASVLVGRLLDRAPGPLARALLGRLIEGESLPALATIEPDSRHDVADVRATLVEDGEAVGNEAGAPDRSPDTSARGWRLTGRKSVVHNAPWASEFIVLARDPSSSRPDGLSLVVVDAMAPGITRRIVRTVDGGWAAELHFDAVRVAPDRRLGARGEALALLAPALDAATLGLCAEACGVLARLLADTVTYAHDRHQFGQPIAGFQVVQHRLADMFIALEQLRAMTAWAAQLVEASEAPAAERERAVSSAKVCAARACRLIGQGAVQLHGGMGMTEELAIGHFFRRATMLEQRFGPVSHHLRRAAHAD